MKKRAAAVLLCLTVACGGSSGPGDDSPTEVIGLITDIEPQDETELPTSFTVEEDDGDAYTIDIDPGFDYGFDLLHVREHFVTEDPVDVAVESRDGALVATSIEDVE
jgi:hypothetical protein